MFDRGHSPPLPLPPVWNILLRNAWFPLRPSLRRARPRRSDTPRSVLERRLCALVAHSTPVVPRVQTAPVKHTAVVVPRLFRASGAVRPRPRGTSDTRCQSAPVRNASLRGTSCRSDIAEDNTGFRMRRTGAQDLDRRLPPDALSHRTPTGTPPGTSTGLAAGPISTARLARPSGAEPSGLDSHDLPPLRRVSSGIDPPRGK